jgi:arsenate reductase
MQQSSLSNYRRKPRLLFIGADNASHTQMAEGYMRNLGGDVLEVQSAGLRSTPVDPHTILIMKEDHIDIRHQPSKLASAELLTWADLIVTLSTNPQALRVAIPNSAHHKNWAIDPPETTGNATDTLREFRKCRNDIKRRAKSMLTAMRLFNST